VTELVRTESYGVNVDFAFLCDHAAASKENIDAWGIGFNEIYARALPWVHPEFWYVAQLSATGEEVGEREFHMSLIDADGAVVTDLSETFPIVQPAPGEETKARIAVAFTGVVFPRYGSYALLLSTDGHELSRLDLAVRAAA
jgi:hypothetical protein